MSSLVVDVDEVIYLLRVNGEICCSEELRLGEVELEVDGEIVALAWV